MNAAPALYEPYRRSILDALQAICLPTPVSLVRDLIVAGGGLSPSPKEMARMLHGDERRFNRTLDMPEDGLVPGISAFGLVAVANTVALATWPTAQRIVGSRTARIVYLRSRLVLPGGLAVELDTSRTTERDELAVLEPLDLEERLSAAASLAVLPERYRLWGRPALIEAAMGRWRSIA